MAELADYPVVIEQGCAMNDGFEAVDHDRLFAAEAPVLGGDSAEDAPAWSPVAVGEPFGGGYGSPPGTVAELEAAASRAAARAELGRGPGVRVT